MTDTSKAPTQEHPLKDRRAENHAAYLRRKARGYYCRKGMSLAELDYERDLKRTSRLKAAQAFADRLVADNPGKTTAELLEMVAPARREALKKLLRYVPPRERRLAGTQPRPVASFTERRRLKTPLTMDLEARLAAAKAKTKRSVPGGRVHLGNASRPEDQADDVVRDFPAGSKIS